MYAARTSRLSLVISVISVIGCSNDDDGLLPPVQVQGRFLSYAADDEFVVCGGTVPMTEAWMEAVALRLGVDLDLILPTTYYFVDQSLLGEMCPPQTAGCASQEGGHIEIFSTKPIEQHELIHAIQFSAWPSSAILLQEGLAQAFEQDTPPLYLPSFTPDMIDAAIEAESAYENDGAVYTVGHYLVYWMLTRYDAEAFEQFWRTTSRPTSAAKFRADFEQIFGESLDQMLADVEGSPLCAISACAGVPVAWVEGTWTTESPKSCGDKSVVGIVGGLYHEVRRDDLLEITAAGSYDLSVSASANVGQGAIVMSCQDGCAQYLVRAGESYPVDLSPGLYRVTTVSSGADDPGIRVDIQPSN
jgi:hypothetical protein